VSEREEALREVGRLRARVEELETSPAVQRAAVEDLGLMWLHACGTVGYGEHPTCGLRTLHSGPWFPLYIGDIDPLVLRLPKVPSGTAALVGIESGRRYARDDAPGDDGEPGWFEGNIGGTLGEVLDGEPEGVRVELGPLRGPRTWPKLDDLPSDIKTIRGASGRTYHQSHFAQSIPIFCEHTDDGRPTGPAIPFHALQTFDGPLTEVLDG
jgi:hypothetical protein